LKVAPAEYVPRKLVSGDQNGWVVAAWQIAGQHLLVLQRVEAGTAATDLLPPTKKLPSPFSVSGGEDLRSESSCAPAIAGINASDKSAALLAAIFLARLSLFFCITRLLRERAIYDPRNSVLGIKRTGWALRA
jgi:hypothetical protein